MHVNNAMVLALYLVQGKLKAHFDMSTYNESDDVADAKCGSVGCVMGHATFFWKKSRDESFEEFISRVLQIPGSAVNDMFNSYWANVDPTPKGAGERILYYIAYGKPPAKGFYEGVHEEIRKRQDQLYSYGDKRDDAYDCVPPLYQIYRPAPVPR